MRRWAAICRFGSIGDNLIAGSPLAVLKRLGYMTEVITSPPSHVVYLHNPHIDKLSVKVSERDLPKGGFEWQQWVESRAQEYDLFGHLSHSGEGRHAVFRNQTEFWWPQDYRRKRCAGSYLETAHDIVGVPHEFGPLYFSSEEEKANALLTKSQIGERCIAWIVCGSRIDKVYPYATMAVSRLVREVGPVVLIGGPSDKEHSMSLAIKEHVELANGSRKGLHLAIPANGTEKCWSLRPALTFLQQCDLVITPDTGPAWAVAMEPMPKVVMVSHASAENITKHWVNTTTLTPDEGRVPCWPCHRLHEDPSTCVTNKEKNGAACISDTSVEKLVATVAEQWVRGDAEVIAFRRQWRAQSA